MADKVICPGVEVLIVMLVPATKFPGVYLVPVESAMSNWPWVVGNVEVPVPPFETESIPLTSAEPKAIAPLNKAPVAVERTGKAEFKEVIVDEPTTTKVWPGVVVPMPTLPAWVTTKREAPEDEVIWKGFTPLDPCMLKV